MNQIKLSDMSTDQLLARFAEIGVAQDEALLDEDYVAFNSLYDQMNEVDRELRTRGQRARLELLRLYNHPNI
jgi:hypothetical protein